MKLYDYFIRKRRILIYIKDNTFAIRYSKNKFEVWYNLSDDICLKTIFDNLHIAVNFITNMIKAKELNGKTELIRFKQ